MFRGMRYVISGASRGIGLELVRQLAARGDLVEALARKPEDSAELQSIAGASSGRVRTFECDVTSDESVAKAARRIGDAPVDVIINNAGASGKMQAFPELDAGDIMRTFDLNALGAIRVTRALLPNLLATATR